MSQMPPAPQRLSAGTLFSSAYGQWFGNVGAWLTAVALPLVISLAIYYGYWEIFSAQSLNELSQQNAGQGFRDFLANIVQIIAFTLFAVSWHRLLVLGEAPKLLPPIGGDHVRFLLWSIGVGLIIGLPAVLLIALAASLGAQSAAVGVVVGFAAVLVAVYVGCRLCVLFPSIAVGRSLGLIGAWRMTAGHGSAIFFASILVSLPFLVVFFALSFMILGGMSASPQELRTMSEAEILGLVSSAYWVSTVLSLILTLAIQTLGLTIASTAYRALR